MDNSRVPVGRAQPKDIFSAGRVRAKSVSGAYFKKNRFLSPRALTGCPLFYKNTLTTRS